MTSYSRKCQNRTTGAQQLPRRRSIYLGLASTCQIREQFERRALLVMDTDVADLNKFLTDELAFWIPVPRRSD